MIVRDVGLGIREIFPRRFRDDRGYFNEVYNADALRAEGISLVFVQDNHSFSEAAGVLRGLHYQLPPHAQDKLVWVARGRIFDVAVDIRRGSPSYGQWVGLELSEDTGNQALIPGGFAHGFVTLEPKTQVVYKVTAPYAPTSDRSIRFDDPDIGIKWPISSKDIRLSDKDRDAPILAQSEPLA